MTTALVLRAATPGRHHTRPALPFALLAAALSAAGAATHVLASPGAGAAGTGLPTAAAGSFGWLVAALAGAAVAGPDVKHRLLAVCLLAEPRRAVVTLARLAQAAAAGAAVGVASAAATAGVCLLLSAGARPTTGAAAALGVCLAVLCAAAGAVGAAVVLGLGDHTVGVTALLGYGLVLEAVVGGALGEAVALRLPGEAARALVTSAGAGRAPGAEPVLVWLALVAVGVLTAVAVTARRDVR